MQTIHRAAVIAAVFALSGTEVSAAEAGDPEAGRQLFRACAACHSVVPGRHMTGPSLASIWGKRAGTVEGFMRYSEALKHSEVVWDEQSLDAWLANPKEFIPGNLMTFRGIAQPARRRDLIAFLKRVSEQDAAAAGQEQGLDLKALEANNRITAITYCGDTYTVMAETGEAYKFWEFNLRFKTDGSENGPAPGHPVIIPSGMQGDRAFVVFATPAEISGFIAASC